MSGAVGHGPRVLRWCRCPECTWRRPRVVCLCGSTKLRAALERAAWEETQAGHIVLMPALVPTGHVARGRGPAEDNLPPGQKAQLDELHRRRIDLADEVLVVTEGGYAGETTRDEVAYARAAGKPVHWSEPEAAW